MEVEKFIKTQLEMLSGQFAKSQIRDNVYRYVFSKGIPNLTINAMIDRCMELYSEIINRYINR